MPHPLEQSVPVRTVLTPPHPFYGPPALSCPRPRSQKNLAAFKELTGGVRAVGTGPDCSKGWGARAPPLKTLKPLNATSLQ